MSSDQQRREAFLHNAAEKYDDMMSRAGAETGDTFDDIERQARHIGLELRRTLLEDRLADESKVDADETIGCPQCGGPMRRPKKPSQRNLETTSGQVRYERCHAICDCCKSSFSPSGPPTEDPS